MHSENARSEERAKQTQDGADAGIKVTKPAEQLGFWQQIRQFFAERILPNVHEFWYRREPLIWFIALAIGIGAGYAAIAFRHLIGLVQVAWLGSTSERVVLHAVKLDWWVILCAPTLGGLAVGLFLHHFMPGRRAHGVADVIEAQALHNCRISTRVGLSSALVAVVSLGSGASAGREGPVVHLGATLAAALRNLFALDQASQRTLLACGVAAAVSASFNVPLAGMLFAHEVILGHYALRAFVPITIASVAGAEIIRIHMGDFPTFLIPHYQIASHWEFPAFALLGVVCAIVAICFQFSVMAADWIGREIRMPLWSRPVVGGFIVGAIGVFFPQILGVGYDSTDLALKEHFPLWLLLSLLVAKIAATSITLASRFGGGVFSPSLYIGAMVGGAFGIVTGDLSPGLSSAHGLYATIGMGAVAAAILGAPISTTMIAFELTGDYSITIAILLAVSISTALHQAIHGASLFHWQLHQRGLYLQEGPHQHIMRTMQVRSFMVPLAEDEAEDALAQFGDETYWLRPTDSVETALRFFDASGHSRVPVVSEKIRGKHVGWALQVDALHAFNQALIAAHIEEHR